MEMKKIRIHAIKDEFLRFTTYVVCMIFLVCCINKTAESILILKEPEDTYTNNDTGSDPILYAAAGKTSASKKKRTYKSFRKQYSDIRTDFISIGGGMSDSLVNLPDMDIEETARIKNVKANLQFKVSYLLLTFAGEYSEYESDVNRIIDTGDEAVGTYENKKGRVSYTMGFSYAFSPRIALTAPYAGLNYNYWRKKGVKPEIIADERYEWFTLGGGMRFHIQLFRNFITGIDLSCGPAFGGRGTIFTVKNTDPNNEDVPEGTYPIFRLHRGWFYRGEMPLELYMGSLFGIEVAPWYERMNLGKSDSKTINVTEEVSVSKMEFTSYGVNVMFKIYF